MYTTSDFRRGMRIIFQDEPYEITDFQHHKPGKGAAIVRTKLRNLITGLTTDPTFRSGDKVARPDLDEKDVQFLYETEGVYHFMDPQSYDQFEVDKKTVGSNANFLVDGMDLSLLFYQGRVISMDLPNNVVLEVADCDPAVRGDTVSGATKLAKLQTGLECQVPLFLNSGEKIRVDTRTGEYMERA